MKNTLRAISFILLLVFSFQSGICHVFQSVSYEAKHRISYLFDLQGDQLAIASSLQHAVKCPVSPHVPVLFPFSHIARISFDGRRLTVGETSVASVFVEPSLFDASSPQAP